jgi:hypothetical protein
MKRVLLGLFLAFTITIAVNAQPYIYYFVYKTDSAYTFSQLPDGTEKISDVQLLTTVYSKRYNLVNSTIEDFPPEENITKDVCTCCWDPTESYINYSEYSSNIIYECSNPSNYFFLEDTSAQGMGVDELLYSKSSNKLYAFYDFYQKLKVIDLSTNKTVSEIKIPGYVNNNDLMHPSRDTFFSSDGLKIFLYSRKPGTQTKQIWTFSLGSNIIINKMNLSEIGHPNADGYAIVFGRKGKGLVESYNNVNEFSSYYSIYDFDNDSGSAFIKYNGRFSEAYFDNDGKYLFVFDTFYDKTNGDYYHTGSVEIYNSADGKLVNTLSLPEQGIIYTFDNYPDDLYYVIDIDSPKRQIFHINKDSLIIR